MPNNPFLTEEARRLAGISRPEFPDVPTTPTVFRPIGRYGEPEELEEASMLLEFEATELHESSVSLATEIAVAIATAGHGEPDVEAQGDVVSLRGIIGSASYAIRVRTEHGWPSVELEAGGARSVVDVASANEHVTASTVLAALEGLVDRAGVGSTTPTQPSHPDPVSEARRKPGMTDTNIYALDDELKKSPDETIRLVSKPSRIPHLKRAIKFGWLEQGERLPGRQGFAWKLSAIGRAGIDQWRREQA